MANSTTTIDTISESQAGKATTANAFFDAASPATAFGRRASTSSGLVFGYYGGNVPIDGVLTQIANGTVTLTANATNYVEIAPTTGVIVVNTTGFTPARFPMYKIITGASTVTSYTDYRVSFALPSGRLVKSITTADVTLTHAEANNAILEFNGAMTANRNVFISLAPKPYIVYNGTTGGFSITITGATGTGVSIAMGCRAIVYADGTNVVRATPDI